MDPILCFAADVAAYVATGCTVTGARCLRAMSPRRRGLCRTRTGARLRRKWTR